MRTNPSAIWRHPLNPEIPPVDCGEYLPRLEWRFAGADPVLARIHDRCVIDSETGCWHWTGAMSRGSVNIAIPVVWHDDKTQSALRVVYKAAGRKIPSRGIVWRSCRCNDCCNPDHLLGGTRAVWGAWRARNGSAAMTPDQRAANTARARSKSTVVLSPERASYIRSSEATGRALAAELGVSASTVSRVRRGEAWQEHSQAASVFSWRP